MAAPVHKVAPNPSVIGQLAQAATAAEDALAELAHSRTQQTLSAFGAVVSSTCPGLLHRSAVARVGIRRFSALR